ncbi:MAG: cyclic nucleotide-binding domain-containing protein [Pseudobdellovibrionaceae bacterium]
MKIENELLDLAPLNLEQIGMSGQIIGLNTKETLTLNAQQIEILKQMQKSTSIEKLVNGFLAQKILISFVGLYHLLNFLLREGLLRNQGFADYFYEIDEPPSPHFWDQIKKIFSQETAPPVEVRNELQKIPFMRSLDPGLLEIFLGHMKIIEAPSGIAICQQGQVQRSLFVLLKGQASIIKRGNYPKPRRVATLSEGSVFGEVGFFLGEPRTADVISEGQCQVVRLKYLPEVFDPLIQKDSARQLHKRLWVIHALLKSEIFRGIPDDCFDALVFAGQIRTVPQNEVICREGDLGEHCYIIVQGSLVVTKEGQPVRVLGQGDCFGEMALMVSQGRRTATVRAQTEAIVLEIPYESFYRLLSQNLLLAVEFEKVAWQRFRKDRERES